MKSKNTYIYFFLVLGTYYFSSLEIKAENAALADPLGSLFNAMSEDNSNTQSGKNIFLKGSLVIAHDHNDNLPECSLYYEGKMIKSDTSGIFTIPIERMTNKYSLLVCNKIEYRFDKNNTLKECIIVPNMNYLLYSYERLSSKEPWNLVRCKAKKKKNFVVPDHCIILLLNPTLIENIVLWKVKLQSNFIPLPQIILKSNCRKKFERAANKAVVKSLSVAPFHEQVVTAEQKTGTAILQAPPLSD